MPEETMMFAVGGKGSEVLRVVMTKPQAWGLLSSILIELKTENESVAIELPGMLMDVTKDDDGS